MQLTSQLVIQPIRVSLKQLREIVFSLYEHTLDYPLIEDPHKKRQTHENYLFASQSSCPTIDDLIDYSHEILEGTESCQEIEEHLKTCGYCREEIEALKRISA